MSKTSRAFDLVLFGATGYTGVYTAEHITQYLPTNLKWAVAGRSHQKLTGLVADLKKLNPDRLQPEIKPTQLNDKEITDLARQTKLLINCVGPYARYAEPVVKACAHNGTHYLDVTGESPWVRDMIRKYDKIAKSNGAIIIHQAGLESVPADLITYAIALELKKASLPPKEVVFSIHKMKGSPSGGTIATVLNIFDQYSLRDIATSFSPAALAAGPVAKPLPQSLTTRLTGVRNVDGLGTLTTSLQGGADLTIVYRSATLMKDLYGNNFHFNPYMTVRNGLLGLMVHVFLAVGPLFLAIWPLRYIFSKIATRPGSGPSKEDVQGDRLEYWAIGLPDSDTKQRVTAKARWEGSFYHFTGVSLGEAAATLLEDTDIPAKKFGGGILTSATLGGGFLSRLAKQKFAIETQLTNF